MAGIRDLSLGRLRFVTFADTFEEGVGDPLQLAGPVAALGARTPKRYSLQLPIHGTSGDANPYAAGMRMRRQVRSLLENQLARSQGFYLNAWLDPDQNGYVMTGAGTINYEPGGISLAEFSLNMDEIYRVASDRSYKPCRRTDLYDRRLSTTQRDFLGLRYSTDFAGFTAGVYVASSWLAWLPPEAADIATTARAFAKGYPVFTQEGFTVAVLAPSNGSIFSFEQPYTGRSAGDVVIWDRQGVGDPIPPLTNLITNPLSSTSTAGWGTGANSFIASGATLTSTSGVYVVGSGAAQVVTTAVANEGISIPLSGTFNQGQPYAARVFIAGNAGGEAVQVILGTTGDSATTAVVATTSHQAVTVSWTPTANRTSVSLFIRGSAAAAITFFANGAMVVASAAAPPYFDGASPGYAWTGIPYASTSQGPFGWYNAVGNGSGKGGNSGWQLTGSGGTLAAIPYPIAADAPFAPYNSFDVSFSGVTSSRYAPSSSGVAGRSNGGLLVASGSTVYAEGWLKPILPLPGGATASIAVLWQNYLGSTISTTTIGSISSLTAVGTWTMFAGTATAPAGAIFATVVVLTAGHSTTTTVRYRFDNALIVDTTTLGLPPSYNPLGFTGVRYFDGDSSRAGWPVGRFSTSVLWVDPQDSPGWEEAYGPEHQLTGGDVPVLGNGICRLRPEVATTGNYYFALDYATPPVAGGGGGWQELGSFQITTGITPTQTGLVSAAIMEWTTEAAIVKATFASAGSGRAEIYITLRRGWSAPRFEVYSYPVSSTTVSWYPNHADTLLLAGSRTDSYGTMTISDTPIGALAPSGTMEPWFAISTALNFRPVIYMIRENASSLGTYGVSNAVGGGPYAAGSPPAFLTYPSPPSGYVSIQAGVGFGAAGAEAETIRNASGTTAQVTPVGVSTPATPNAPTTSTTGGTLPTATTYFYKITAVGNLMETPASPASTSVTTGAGSTNSNTVTWTAATGATGYRIWVSTTGASGTYNLAGSATGTTFTQTTTVANALTPPTVAPASTASGNSFVTETQTAATNATLTIPGGQLMVDGTYALLARVRVLSGDTINASFSAAAGNLLPTPSGSLVAGAMVGSPTTATQAGWVWVYVGELNVVGFGISNPISAYFWITRLAANSAITSNLAIDEVAFIPTQRGVTNTSAFFDGARDQAAQSLIDLKLVPDVVAR